MRTQVQCFIFILVLLNSSCQNKNYEMENFESPFMVVVKLESAESNKDFDSAIKFIDIEKVYHEVALKENKTAREIWTSIVEFNYSIGNSSKKFSDKLFFYKYRIEEIINKDIAEIRMTKIDDSKQIIIYSLLRYKGAWKVVSIKYPDTQDL